MGLLKNRTVEVCNSSVYDKLVHIAIHNTLQLGTK